MAGIHAESFNKGEGTRIVSFVAPDKSTELDIITVEKNMPEAPLGEVWLKNRESGLIAIAIKGAGRIATRQVVNGLTLQERMEIGGETQAAYVPAGVYYAWENDYSEPLVVAASFTPAFDPEAYVERTEEELQLFERLVELTASYLTADDVDYIEELEDNEAAINYVFGRLADTVDDPGRLFVEFNIFEEQ